MGCTSTSAQTDNVITPSSNYIQSKQQVPSNKELLKKKEDKVIEPKEQKIVINVINQDAQLKVSDELQNKINHKETLQESPQVKKEEERAMTAATQEMKHEAMKPVPEGKAFLFGQSENQRKILLLDCQKMQISILSNKTQASEIATNKYQPKQIIFEESQELFESYMFDRNSHPPYNFMFITFISDQTIFLCGGVNSKFDYFSDQSFFFRVASITKEQPQSRRKKGGNSLMGNKFEKLPSMHQRRFSHMGAYFKTGKLGYIYVFGGRDDKEELLSSCEQYSIEQKKWRQITPMKVPRSTGFSLIFKSKIYVFGGYTGEQKRSKLIEVYDPSKNYWEVLNVKLHRGIEAGLLFSVKPNEILLMGGNMELGSLKSVIKINLADETYVWDSNMKNERLLQKGVKLKESIFIFGGDFKDTFEKYSTKDRKWKDHQFSYNQFVSVDDINSYQMANQTLEVSYDQTPPSKIDVGDYQRYCIFGNDNYPCILELNISKWVLKKKVVPMAMRLRCNMGVVKVMDGKYFLCGGIDSFNEKPSKASYVYYTGTNKAIEVAKMSSKKHQFAICGNSKYVYTFGGRNQSNQIIRECQKYSFQMQEWISLPELPNERAGGKAVMVGTKILLFGGQDIIQNVTAIDIFDTETDTFWQSQQILSIPTDVRAVCLDNSQTPGVFIFTYNDMLSKYYTYYLPLKIPHKNETVEHQKIEQNFSMVRQVEEIQLNVKLIPFIYAFKHNGKVNFITSKGLFNWEPSKEVKEGKAESQIVINQVEMLQYPIEKFSVA